MNVAKAGAAVCLFWLALIIGKLAIDLGKEWWS